MAAEPRGLAGVVVDRLLAAAGDHPKPAGAGEQAAEHVLAPWAWRLGRSVAGAGWLFGRGFGLLGSGAVGAGFLLSRDLRAPALRWLDRLATEWTMV